MKRIIFALVVGIMLRPAVSMADIDDDLSSAISKNDIQKVNALISEGADVNAKNSGSQTPLMEAAVKGCSKIAKLLIAKGANVNARSVKGETALSLAMSSKYSDIECLVLETPLLSAEVVSAAKPVVEGGNPVSTKASDDVESSLKEKCQDPTKMVKVLVDNGADVNSKDPNGRTLLMIAAIRGYTEIAKLLIAKGADVNVKSDKNETALSLAKANNNNEIIRLLTEAGAK